MIDQVFVAERQREDALAGELGRGVPDSRLVTEVGEALAESLEDPAPLLDLTEEQEPSVGRDRASVEGGSQKAPVGRLRFEAARATLCHRTRWWSVWCCSASQPQHSASSASFKLVVVMDAG